MNRLAIKFLFFFVPILALSLAWLGFQTISTHLIGWFLMLVGVLFSVGIFIAYIIKGNTLWNGVEGNKPIQQETGDRSFWLVVLSMIFAFYLPPVEYLFLDFSVSPTPGMIWAGLGLIIIGCFEFPFIN